jgi:probable phosphoglycerate mutase
MTMFAPPLAAGDPVIVVPGLAHPVWLIRHAPTSWTGRRWCGRADPPLTRAGRALAHELATAVVGAIATGTPVAVRSSPARRARATADAIAAVRDWPVREDPDLLEVDVGAAEGLTWTELSERLPDVAATLGRGERVDWPGGEAIAAVEARARRAGRRVLAAGRNGPVVVVSHGALLHALAARIAPGDAPPFFGPGGILRLVPKSP